jgi:FkbM family methyltransferase
MAEMIGKLAKLVTHPGFRAAPVTVMARGLVLAGHVALRKAPVFPLVPGGPRLTVPADLRYTTITGYMMRENTEPELAALGRFLGLGGVFVDAGANIGLFSLMAARLVGPTGRVLAVEPGEESLARLDANLALNQLPQVKVIRAALGAEPGAARLFHVPLGDDPQAYSLLPESGATESEAVPVTTLDLLAEQEGLTRLDCFKLDVEGAEPMIIAGSRATLARFRPIVIFEVNTPIALARGDAAASFEALTGMGYAIHRLDGAALTPLAAMPAEWGNLVAIHPEGPQPR